jgi:hypothetical protein
MQFRFNRTSIGLIAAALISVGCVPVPVQVQEPTATPEILADCFLGFNMLAWVDADGDGVQDEGESPLEGVTFAVVGPFAHSFSGTEVQSDAEGAALFSTWSPGGCHEEFEFEISATAPAGYTPTTPSAITIPFPEARDIQAFGFAPLAAAEPTPTTAPTPTLAAPPDDLTPGMLMSAGDIPGEASMLLMDEAGMIQSLTHIDGLQAFGYVLPGFEVSPDGISALYVAHDDIWRLDATGETTNLTNTPQQIETFPKWWGTDTFAYVIHPEGGGAMLNARGPEGVIEIITPGQFEQGFIYAPSHDGERIAIVMNRYDDAHPIPAAELWLYERDGSMTQLDLGAMGLAWEAGVFDVSWSPDGSTLGLAMVFQSEPAPGAAILTLDVDAGSSRVVQLLPYEQGSHAPLAYSAPRWSPDGAWFVFYYADGPEETDGLWLVKGDGEARHIDTSHLFPGSWTWGHAQPFISPDGEWVVIETGFGNRDKLLLRAGEWEPILWQEPSVMVEGWMAALPEAADGE